MPRQRFSTCLGLFLWCMLLCTIFQPTTSVVAEEEDSGVDDSWPTHYLLASNLVKNKVVSQRYHHYMQGCANYYSKQECQTSDQERILMNLRQPKAMQNYTAAGYAKMRAPAAVFETLRQFYDTHSKLRQVREQWPPGNIYTNHWASTVKILPVAGLPATKDELDPQPSLSQKQRHDIIQALQSELEAWCKMPLIATSLYGIRVYKRGAILAPHVDRLPLVISVIINVAQQVEDDWPLEVIGHDGKARNVTLQPGEMLLYESASVIHGRPYPMNGQFYANVFAHFEPVGHSERHMALRQDPKKLFEEALQKHQQQEAQSTMDAKSSRHNNKQTGLPYYVPPKYQEQWEQKYVYVKHPRKDKKAKELEKKKEDEEEDALTKSDSRAFHNLASKGMLLKMKEMVKEDPNVVTQTDHNGWLALHEAARAGHVRVVDYLCNLMDQTEINSRTNMGKGGTALWWALHTFDEDHPVVKTLLRHGAKSIAPE